MVICDQDNPKMKKNKLENLWDDLMNLKSTIQSKSYEMDDIPKENCIEDCIEDESLSQSKVKSELDTVESDMSQSQRKGRSSNKKNKENNDKLVKIEENEVENRNTDNK